MDLFRDPGPSLDPYVDFELQDFADRRRRLTDKREWREALAEAEHRIERLETALTATIRALAFSETTYPGGRPEKHGLCGKETAEHLTRAAQVLGLDLNDLGLAYAITATCPHGDDPVFCNECRAIHNALP